MPKIEVPDSLKMIRETLCVAQSRIGNSPYDENRKREHVDRISRMIADIDRQRPLGPDGKHGALHTRTCGCSDVPRSRWERIRRAVLGIPEDGEN